MSRPRMRPRFSLSLEGSADDARARIVAALADAPSIRGGAVGERVELRMPEEEQHYWSLLRTFVTDALEGEERG